jgi:hypothetical protein
VGSIPTASTISRRAGRRSRSSGHQKERVSCPAASVSATRAARAAPRLVGRATTARRPRALASRTRSITKSWCGRRVSIPPASNRPNIESVETASTLGDGELEAYGQPDAIRAQSRSRRRAAVPQRPAVHASAAAVRPMPCVSGSSLTASAASAGRSSITAQVFDRSAELCHLVRRRSPIGGNAVGEQPGHPRQRALTAQTTAPPGQPSAAVRATAYNAMVELCLEASAAAPRHEHRANAPFRITLRDVRRRPPYATPILCAAQ